MPDIAAFHPQIVHFVIALGLTGIVFRVVSLSGRLTWTRPASAALLITAALASLAAVQSGTQAHGPAERVPGARDAVIEHEEAGERARTILLVIGVLEVGALAARRREAVQRGLHVASALAGIYAGFALFEAGEHGGELVYSYAGGVGLRTGDSTDVRRLLVAGLYHQARVAREAGHGEEAARLTDELSRQVPGDPTVTFLVIESRIRDRNDPAGALAELAAMTIPADVPRLAIRHGMLTAQALQAAGQVDSARAVLTTLATKFPEVRSITDALERLPKP